MNQDVLSSILERHAETRGALLPVLHAVQEAFGHVPPESVTRIAESLRVSRAEVHGLITFFHDLRLEPGGRTRVQVCRAEACQSVGGRDLEAAARQLTGLDFGETSADGSITLDAVYCLGNCACGPSVRIDDTVHGAVDANRLAALLESARSDVSVVNLGSGASAPAAGAMLRVFVPSDTTAGAVGADTVAQTLLRAAASRGFALELVRNGSRGAAWLEPLVEIERDGQRIGFANVTTADVESLLEDDFAATHPRCVGAVEALPWLVRQQRTTFRRIGRTDPLSLADYRREGGMVALQHALTLSQQQIVDALKASGLRGRGGAAFPSGIKWQTVLDTPSAQKFVVCNAEEGDSGTFADRLVIEADPYQLLEGMVIAGLAVGADKGFIGLRIEYPRAARVMSQALERARADGWLGTDVLGSGRAFDIELRIGAGAYVCGEETSLLEILEGRRGTVRAKPPLPAIKGLFGKPTLIHNVLSLVAVTSVLAEGPEAYWGVGIARSRGTLAVQLGGNIKRGGLVEVPFGTSLRQLVEDFGAGTRSGRPIRAIQVGGPLGAYLPPSQWDTPLDYEAFAALGALVGHGGVVVFDDTVDMRAQARFAMEFCALESCGKCTPCRIGSTRGVELLDKISADDDRAANMALLEDLCGTLTNASLCALGSLTPLPVMSAIRHWPEDFAAG